MSSAIRLNLRAGERIYINGAVLRVDRKITLEVLNDATFLLENHVIQPEEATTPLRQLYFALQTLLIEPSSATAADACKRISKATVASFSSPEVLEKLQKTDELVSAGRVFEGMKVLRSAFAAEAAILAGQETAPSRAA